MRRAMGSGEAVEQRPRGYRGVRRRRWGKWVSEIRVPGTRERLWLGSYATPEAAAVAHDTAVYFLRGGGGDIAALNFPERAAAAYGGGHGAGSMSPRSVQRAASDAGMAADAQLVAARDSAPGSATRHVHGASIGNAHDGASAARPHAVIASTSAAGGEDFISRVDY